MTPTIDRRLFVPVFVFFAAVTFLTAATSHLCLSAEFHAAKWIVDSHPPLPPFTALLAAIYPFVWLLPLCTVATGLWCCRRSSLPAEQFVWFVCSLSFTLFVWFLLVAFAFFWVYSQRGHYITPLSSP